MLARQTWVGSAPHCHQARRSEPGATPSGESAPLRVGCHSRLRKACDLARDDSGEGIRWAQNGHSVCLRVRSRTLARHSCVGSIAQRHHAIRAALATTSYGLATPFRMGCHSAATRGKHVAKQLVTDTLRFAQKGHPVPPDVRLFGEARQRWSGPRGHVHQILRPDPAGTTSGVRVPLWSASHSRTNPGCPETQ